MQQEYTSFCDFKIEKHPDGRIEARGKDNDLAVVVLPDDAHAYIAHEVTVKPLKQGANKSRVLKCELGDVRVYIEDSNKIIITKQRL